MASNNKYSPNSQQFSTGFINFMKGNYIESPEPPLSPEKVTPHRNSKIMNEYMDLKENQNQFWDKNVDKKYKLLSIIGQGSYGVVRKAQNILYQNIVAIKELLYHNTTEGFPITALREVRILQKLRHENIVRLIEICYNEAKEENNYRSKFYLILEFCEYDLARLLNAKYVQFDLSEIKELIRQLLNGLHYMHTNKILHRDLKTSNILVTNEGILKIADFGLSRSFSIPTKDKPNKYTNRVVTLWYRAPELLLGERNYGPAIDMWGAGCIMAEFWTRCPIMRGSSEAHQLKCISFIRGKITPEVWPKVVNYDIYKNIVLPENYKVSGTEWKHIMHCISNVHGCDLLEKLLHLDPEKRCDANTALDHDFFWTDPMPTNLSNTMSKIHITYNYECSITQRVHKNQPIGKPRVSIHDEQHSELLKIAQYVFAIPAHNANVERVFSLMEIQWTDERNRLQLDTVESIIMCKYNYKKTCSEFYEYVKTQPSLLTSVKSSKKYEWYKENETEEPSHPGPSTSK
ncbi:cyclin-dependent kinase 9-like [Metopolophium dirhodum]|uniref:cyclin-dependent kinase 9-like n=1 Tax=Metopolophium dirhodum TaxID=44670 RepID=UPI00299078BB|nr:cyclin-dependent kinase 9-like [Metopolophium dirhodum]